MTASPSEPPPRHLAAVPDAAAAVQPGLAVADPAPNPHATAEQVEAARKDTKLAQVLYHDWEAETYDEKWSISYDERCIAYARGRFDAIAGEQPLPYGRALELGCGTGFFLLNLMQGGVASTGSVTDLSPGMVKVALRNAEHLGLPVDGRVADAERIPYDDNTFDLVVGHAVLHHIPDVEQALRECLRVLKPGGRFVFAGEPTTVGNFYARWLGRATWAATTSVTKLPLLKDWRRPQSELDESSRAAALEAVVDLHTFDPAELEAIGRAAGAGGVRARTEEFVAALWGWPVRTFEAAIPEEKLTWRYRMAMYRAWLGLSWVDENVLRHVVPRKFFYNAMVTGVKPVPPVVPYAFTRHDVGFLRTASLDVADAAALTPASLLADLARLRGEYGPHAAAVAETVMLRRRAASKLDNAASWLFTSDALQQATPTVVAAHRARRLAGRDVHDVTCSIGAELAALTGIAGRVLGSDLDPVRLAMAQHNVPAAALLRADALAPSTRGTAVIADPARRADGRRTHDPALLQPPLPALLEVYRGRDLAVKCAPGLDTSQLGWTGEVELISLDGGVREACLWSAGLATPGVRSRATVLTSAGGHETYTDADPFGIPERPPGEWIINPDGAVVRAGLVRHYAARHGLWQLDPRIAYLTGDAVPAGVRAFRIHARMKFREKALRSELARIGCGALEILARGVDVDPDALRTRLLAGRKKVRDGTSYAVVITRIGDTPVAFICTASGPGGTSGRG